MPIHLVDLYLLLAFLYLAKFTFILIHSTIWALAFTEAKQS